MVAIRCLSDLHCEFTNGNYQLPVMDDEENTVLCYAGDLGVADQPTTYCELMEEWCGRFKAVMYIPGNHEHYKSSIWRTTEKINRNLEFYIKGGKPDNLHFDDFFSVVVDDVAFICATMWANFDNGNPVAMANAGLMMNDYRVIRNGPSKMDPYKWKLQPVHTYELYKQQSAYVHRKLNEYRERGMKTVVMTHHAPSFQSISPHYAGSDLNAAYASELYNAYSDDAMPILHIHGHVHDSFDYMLGDTRVVCNPRGYLNMGPGDLNSKFNPNLVIDV